MKNLTINIVVSRRANIAYIDADGNIERRNVNISKINCHMLHKDGSFVAAFSNCIDGQMMGFISTDKDTFEIAPFTKRLLNLVQEKVLKNSRKKFLRKGDDIELEEGMLIKFPEYVKDMYIVKRATFPNFTADDTEDIDIDNWENEEDDSDGIYDIGNYPIEPDYQYNEEDEIEENKMIETAVFLDHVGYSRLSQVIYQYKFEI